MMKRRAFITLLGGAAAAWPSASGARAAARAHADFLIKQIDDDAFLHKTPVLMS